MLTVIVRTRAKLLRPVIETIAKIAKIATEATEAKTKRLGACDRTPTEQLTDDKRCQNNPYGWSAQLPSSLVLQAKHRLHGSVIKAIVTVGSGIDAILTPGTWSFCLLKFFLLRRRGEFPGVVHLLAQRVIHPAEVRRKKDGDARPDFAAPRIPTCR